MHYRKSDFTYAGHNPYKIFLGEKELLDCVEANEEDGWAITEKEVSIGWGTSSYTSVKKHYGKIYIVKFEGYDEDKSKK